MYRSTLAALLLALVLCASAQPAGLFLVSGRGFGHGIGMSQYGAYGLALQGWTYDRIVAHYYPGTELGQAAVSKVRILLDENQQSVVLSSDQPFSVRDASGATLALPAGSHRLDRGFTLPIDGELRALAPPLLFMPGSAPLRFRKPYRGTLTVLLRGKRLAVVNTLGLERYLYGVIASEMPANWAPEALKAQAVAARSYALSSLSGGGDFDLYADTRSQVYRGIDSEQPAASAAADATAGQVALYRGTVAKTFFFSTSGGRTAAIRDVWPDAQELPYLVSVDDPYDSISPYHVWGPVVLSGRQLAAGLGAQAPRDLRDLTLAASASGRVATLTLVGSTQSAVFDGSTARRALGLRSTWFDVGVLTLFAELPRVLFRQDVVLQGVLRGVGGVRLQSRERGQPWRDVLADGAALAPAPDGTYSLTVAKLAASTLFRLSSPLASGASVRVSVATRVSFLRRQQESSLAGRVRPKVEGVEVAIERRGRQRWKRVATALTDARGEFRAELEPIPGTYRARAAVSGYGLVPGVTAPLEILP